MSITQSPNMNHELIATPYGEHGVSFAFACLGRRIAFSLGDTSLLPGVTAVLPPGWYSIAPHNIHTHFRVDWLTATDSRFHAAGYVLFHNGEQRRWTTDTAEAITQIESMTEHEVAEFADPWLFMHAGVVGWNGSAIVLPGASHAGKSTLVAALVEAGATYFSDEYAVLDAEGRVLPFPRRLSLRDGPLGLAARLDLRQHGPALNEFAHPLPIGRVIMLRYRQAGDLRLNMLPPGAAIMDMCLHMMAFRRRPKEVMETLETITRRAQLLAGERGEAREAARVILSTD